MKTVRNAALGLLLAALALPAEARRGEPLDPGVAAEARQSLEGILDLWRAGDYAGVYDQTSVTGRESREAFARKLANASRRPACCWEKMQEPRVTARSGDAVTVRARFGLEGPGETEHSTRSVRLVREDEGWRVAQADILALAGVTKKRHRHVRKTAKEGGDR